MRRRTAKEAARWERAYPQKDAKGRPPYALLASLAACAEMARQLMATVALRRRRIMSDGNSRTQPRTAHMSACGSSSFVAGTKPIALSDAMVAIYQRIHMMIAPGPRLRCRSRSHPSPPGWSNCDWVWQGAEKSSGCAFLAPAEGCRSARPVLIAGGMLGPLGGGGFRGRRWGRLHGGCLFDRLHLRRHGRQRRARRGPHHRRGGGNRGDHVGMEREQARRQHRPDRQKVFQDEHCVPRRRRGVLGLVARGAPKVQMRCAATIWLEMGRSDSRTVPGAFRS
jgi:hypothetical protein